MTNICLFDPGYENNDGKFSSNLGDLIIRESVLRELNNIFQNEYIMSVSTQQYPDWHLLKRIYEADYKFVGGTNLLSSNMNAYNQWKIRLHYTPIISNVILMGVGWWQYQEEPNNYTKLLLNRVLSKKYYHSVRDEYTADKLRGIGIKNVINTGCPTMWELTNCQAIPQRKAESVLTMLTDYNTNTALDLELLNILKDNYRKIYFWPQGRNDERYINELGLPVEIIDRSLSALDQFIDSNIDFDYIGTRLHGGVRCLAKSRRALIVAVDNRAKEISKDTNLPIVERNDLDAIKKWINYPNKISINVNQDRISQWKNQFN